MTYDMVCGRKCDLFVQRRLLRGLQQWQEDAFSLRAKPAPSHSCAVVLRRIAHFGYRNVLLASRRLMHLKSIRTR